MKKSCSKNREPRKRLTFYLTDGRVQSGVYPQKEAESRIAAGLASPLYLNHKVADA